VESAVRDSTPSPDPYRLPGPKAIVVGIDASRVGLGIFTFYSREDGTQEDATYSSGRSSPPNNNQNAVETHNV
jgi:hypothetical protein